MVKTAFVLFAGSTLALLTGVLSESVTSRVSSDGWKEQALLLSNIVIHFFNEISSTVAAAGGTAIKQNHILGI